MTVPPGFDPENPWAHRYTARVKIRRGPELDVKPEAEPLDGKVILVRYAWKEGEMIAWEIIGEDPFPALRWISGHDLTDWTPLS